MITDNPALERIWRELRPHLGWANGFNLVFLFADHPAAVDILRSRFDDSLHLRTLRLRVLMAESPDALGGITEAILTARPGSGPLWVELWRQGEDPDWRRARAALMQRLNERRSILEKKVCLPLVMVLPTAERGGIYSLAPDLWAVRSFTAQLTGLAGPIPTHPRSIVSYEAEFKPNIDFSSPGLAELEWARLLERTVDPMRLNPWDGVAAFEAAMERGDLQAARRVASETLQLTRTQLYTGNDKKPSRWGQITRLLRKSQRPPPDPDRQRNLSAALDNLGGVEADLGNLEPARAAYRESLELRRQLRDALGDTPQALRDLSVSLNKVGGVEADLGNLEPARAAYRESLELSRQLRDACPTVPQFQRDLAWIEARWAAWVAQHGEN